MRILNPIVGANEDLEDPRIEWLAYMRTRWYERLAGPSLLSGVAGGLIEPDFSTEWRTFVSPQAARGFRPPWFLGDRPPPFHPVELPAPSSLRTTDLIPVAAQRKFDWLNLSGPQYIPLFVVPAAPTVTQIDPRLGHGNSGPGPDLQGLLDHRAASAAASLLNSGIAQSYSRTLPLEARTVGGLLSRGANIVRVGGKFVVEIGKRILGPVGYAGAAKDLYDFIQWQRSLQSPTHGRMPGAAYQPATNSIEFTLKDGTVLVVPVSQLD